MKNDTKNIVVTVLFITILSGFMLTNIIIPDNKFSISERRKLKNVPEYTFDRLLSGDFFDDYEKYYLDQFVVRDYFRSLKAYFKYYGLAQKENNDIYIINNNNINKINYPLNEKSVLNGAKKLNEVYEKYLKGKDVYYSIIPDKNFFVAASNGYPAIDYNKMIDIMSQNVQNMRYIDIFDSLTIDDYYYTDIHWRQERIIDIADIILSELGNSTIASSIAYKENKHYPFYGSYYGQAAVKVRPDTLVYLTNEIIENASVYDYVSGTNKKVYIPELFNGMDPYDLFLSGAMPLLTISNPDCKTEKELILFRDSFGSSLAPLLIAGYSKITLVDLRYISTDILDDFIDFTKAQDVLFLYNTQILNNSYMLK